MLPWRARAQIGTRCQPLDAADQAAAPARSIWPPSRAAHAVPRTAVRLVQPGIARAARYSAANAANAASAAIAATAAATAPPSAISPITPRATSATTTAAAAATAAATTRYDYFP